MSLSYLLYRFPFWHAPSTSADSLSTEKNLSRKVLNCNQPHLSNLNLKIVDVVETQCIPTIIQSKMHQRVAYLLVGSFVQQLQLLVEFSVILVMCAANFDIFLNEDKGDPINLDIGIVDRLGQLVRGIFVLSLVMIGNYSHLTQPNFKRPDTISSQSMIYGEKDNNILLNSIQETPKSGKGGY